MKENVGETIMPEAHILSQYHSRTDVLKMIANENGIGVELGVAKVISVA